jgi:single-strand DNA-binding protein
MNNVSLTGRLVRNPEVRYSQGENPTGVARYTLAVSRPFKSNNGGQDADFISCVAFGKSAEFAEKYMKQGMMFAVTGRIQTGSYDGKDGKKVYTTDVVVATQEFCEKKGDVPAAGNTAKPAKSAPAADGFMNIPDGVDDELPFN